jgi:hypothetical protein
MLSMQGTAMLLLKRVVKDTRSRFTLCDVLIFREIVFVCAVQSSSIMALYSSKSKVLNRKS